MKQDLNHHNQVIPAKQSYEQLLVRKELSFTKAAILTNSRDTIKLIFRKTKVPHINCYILQRHVNRFKDCRRTTNFLIEELRALRLDWKKKTSQNNQKLAFSSSGAHLYIPDTLN